MLAEIWQVLSSDGDLSKMVPYRLKEKGQNERARRSKLSDYAGPDSDTKELLVSNYNLWLADPSAFWTRTLPIQINFLGPPAEIVGRLLQMDRDDAHSRMIRRCSCILLVKLRAQYPHCSAEETALALYRSGLFAHNLRMLIDAVATMMDAGHRYQNMENSLGIGTTIFLGKDTPESTYEYSSYSKTPTDKMQVDEIDTQKGSRVFTND